MFLWVFPHNYSIFLCSLVDQIWAPRPLPRLWRQLRQALCRLWRRRRPDERLFLSLVVCQVFLTFCFTKKKFDPFYLFNLPQKAIYGWGRLHRTEVPILLHTQWPWVWFSASPKNYFDVAEINWWGWLETRGQRVENVDRTHLVLACGKLVLQKISGS